MDCQLLTSTFNFFKVVDDFETFIWTERYSSPGDVTITISSNSPMRQYLTPKRFVTIPDSVEVARIETVEEKDGIVTATGPMLTDFLRRRAFVTSWAKDHNNQNNLSGTIIKNVLNQAVVAGGGMSGGTIFPAGYVELISYLSMGSQVLDGNTIQIAVPHGDLLTAIKTVADADNIGFRMYPNVITPTSYTLVLDTYRGLDRTSSQSNNTQVILDSALDSLANVHKLNSIVAYATHAYVSANGSKDQTEIGFAQVAGGSSLSDFDHQTIYVEASDINMADYRTNSVINAAGIALLNQRAKSALAQNNYVRMTDGTLVPQSQDNVFGIDYFLGDILELRSTTMDKARVTEYIRSQDANGEQAYPTLSVI